MSTGRLGVITLLKIVIIEQDIIEIANPSNQVNREKQRNFCSDGAFSIGVATILVGSTSGFLKSPEHELPVLSLQHGSSHKVKEGG